MFPLGKLVATPGALKALQENQIDPLSLVRRHLTGDWGDLDHHDQQANEDALNDGARIFSAYKMNDELKIWVITESDRSSTCILLPDEY
ncbi:MAG: hypothetical protein JWP44_4483 [Mucilaginibacter sp.]|nr:hypothetical protein [Mucilaginibacter sp.]